MNLPAANVEFDHHGVKVNTYLQSVSNPAVYAAGDAANSGGLPETPIADYEGSLAARNLIEGNNYTTDFRGMASVVFTIPPLARVGLTEEDAQRQDLALDVKQGDRCAAAPCLWSAARLRVENQLGSKMVKWIERIEFIESEKLIGAGQRRQERR